jgi:hypothetical protein
MDLSGIPVPECFYFSVSQGKREFNYPYIQCIHHLLTKQKNHLKRGDFLFGGA